jgi:hypothetical protein
MVDRKNIIYLTSALLLSIIVISALWFVNPPTNDDKNNSTIEDNLDIENIDDLTNTHARMIENSSYKIESTVTHNIRDQRSIVRVYADDGNSYYEREFIEDNLVSETYSIGENYYTRDFSQGGFEMSNNESIANTVFLNNLLKGIGYEVDGVKNRTFSDSEDSLDNDYIRRRFGFSEINKTEFSIKVEEGIIKNMSLEVTGRNTQGLDYELSIVSSYQDFNGSIDLPNWTEEVEDRPVIETSLEDGYLRISHESGSNIYALNNVVLYRVYGSDFTRFEVGPEVVNLANGGEIYIDIKEDDIDIVGTRPDASQLAADEYYFRITDGQGNTIVRRGYKP